MRDGNFAYIMQQQEADKAQKSLEKEKWAMSSTPTGKTLILIQRVLYLHHFIHSSIPHNLGVSSKVTTLAMDSIFFLVDGLLHLQAVFRVTRDFYFGRMVAIHKLVIARDDPNQYIDETYRKDHQ